MGAARIPLAGGLVALVDESDAQLVLESGSKWRAVRDGSRIYARRHVRAATGRHTSQPLHTFLTGWPLVDHVDGDGLNNTRANLRPASPSENAQNRRVRGDSKSGLKGVREYRPGRWLARIQVGSQRLHLGVYASPIDAALAYDAAAAEHFGEFARLNYPISANGA